jgi:hypothetical protein
MHRMSVVNSRRKLEAATRFMHTYNCSGLWGREALQYGFLCGVGAGLHVSDVRVRTEICIEEQSTATLAKDTVLLGNSASANTAHFQS